jgi:cholesterol oxidase
MLGVRVNPTMTPADQAVRNVAARMGRAETFRLTPVAVYFGGQPGEQAADPYSGGAGPRRRRAGAARAAWPWVAAWRRAAA